MRCLPVALLSLGVTLVTGEPARAQNEEPRLPSSLGEGLLARFDEASTKIVQLAQAFPAEKYRWRPAAGARSVGEVLVHVGMGNYYTLDGAGVKPSVRLTEDEETTITAKPEVIEFFRKSNEEMRNVLRRLHDADLAQPAGMFGQKTTAGNVYLFGVTHLHEHLGQLVSYARMNGVVPPWSVKSRSKPSRN